MSDEEIKQRLIKLRNYERLYPKAREKIVSLTNEVKSLKAIVAIQQKTIDDLKLQMEELRAIVFKKKKPGNHGWPNRQKPPKDKIPRTLDSYRRPTPPDDQVTETKPHAIGYCSCGGMLTKKKEVIFYEEDIPIPAQKIVRKHVVEKGWCPACQTWESAIPLPSSNVILGPNVRKYACYLSVMCRLSFAQIQNLLHDTWQLHISQGEIAHILNQEAQRLQPFYEQLQKRIRGEPAIHLDETSWRLFIDPDASFAWVMSGAQSNESVFLLGENRGKGNADILIGEHYDGVVVTDDYGAYRKLQNHQLCWAHLLRKFRDLANSHELTESQIDYCKKGYQHLYSIYEDIKNNRHPKCRDAFTKRLANVAIITTEDTKKMTRLKTTLKKNIQNYLTCLKDPSIPMTNNLAERSLRHLVLKRKISFGSLTKKTADNLAILLSVLMSLKQRHQGDFFLEYLKV